MSLSFRQLQILVGIGAIIAPGIHALTDLAEWMMDGFSAFQLWANYLSFTAIPFVIIGLYAVQRPKIGAWGLVGTLLYGASFVYFAHTTLYAIMKRIPNYEELLDDLGTVYTAHGAVMILGGISFGAATYQARVFPAWASIIFLGGVLLNLVLAATAAPDLLQTLGSALRNLGLMGMGLSLVSGLKNVQDVA